jgi:serine/threonine protein kinase
VSSASGPGGARILAGRYRLDEVIGRGGMSTVYRGTDLSLDRVVAVKVAMDPLLERDPVYAARFKREARAAAALNHPGVVTVFDAGADGPTRYIVMEYVDGRDLAEILREQEPVHRLEPRWAARIAEQIAETLAAAHAAGIVHRDIKPGNVMIVEGPGLGHHPRDPAGPDSVGERVKVLDFGIARTPDGVTLTQTASVLGTAPYMSPEQATGQPADARSDIYSLGCVLYEMLTGKPPFMGDVPAAVLHQHVRVAAKAPSAVNPAVPPALDALTMEMLAKAPRDRPQTAVEVHDRLAAYETHTEPTQPLPGVTRRLPGVTRPLPVAEALAAAAAAAEVPQVATVPQAAAPAPEALAPTPPAGSAPGRATAARPPRPPGRGSGPWVLLAVIALILLGAAVAYALTGGGSSNTSSTSSHRASGAIAPAHSSRSPASSRHSSSSSTPSIPTTTTTVTATTTPAAPTAPTAPTSPPGPPPAPPGQGGLPPGHGKKGKK